MKVDVVLAKQRTQGNYVAHGQQRTVFALENSPHLVLKVAEPLHRGSNEVEVELALRFTGLFPKVHSFGEARLWDTEGKHRKGGDMHFMVVERVPNLADKMCGKSPEEKLHILALAALYIIQLSQKGVLVSDAKLENLGLREDDSVVALDFASYTCHDGEVKKRDVNARSMYRFFESADKHAEEAVVQKLRETWRQCHRLGEFVAEMQACQPSNRGSGEETHESPWSEELATADLQTSVPGERRAKIALTRITVRSGWFLDSVKIEITLEDGTMLVSHAGGEGGSKTETVDLAHGEYIEKVKMLQRPSDRDYNAIGRELTFVTSADRVISFNGEHKGKRHEHRAEIEADLGRGRTIVGVEFDDTGMIRKFRYGSGRPVSGGAEPKVERQAEPKVEMGAEQNLERQAENPRKLQKVERRAKQKVEMKAEPKVEKQAENLRKLQKVEATGNVEKGIVTVITDSTFGFHQWNDRNFHDSVTRAESGRMIRFCGQNGGTMTAMAEKVLASLGKDAHGSFEMLYVPMSNSLPESRQKYYVAHAAAQNEIFSKVNGLTATTEIMSFEARYTECCYSGPYWDSCGQLYNQKQKVHVRPGACKFLINDFLDSLPANSLLLCCGWNSSEPSKEFAAQLEFLRKLSEQP